LPYCLSKEDDTMKIKICEVCGNEIKSVDGKPVNNNAKVCSEYCRKNKFKLTCINCEKGFTHWRKDRKFCSTICKKEYNDSKLVELTCAGCENKFSRPSFTIRDKERSFCSQRCANRIHSREQERRYSSGWTVARRKKVKEDDYTCAKCGFRSEEPYALEVHHIVDKKHFKTEEEANQSNNLETLCRDCHWKHHGKSSQNKQGRYKTVSEDIV